MAHREQATAGHLSVRQVDAKEGVAADTLYLNPHTGDEIIALGRAQGGRSLIALWDGSVSSDGGGGADTPHLVLYDATNSNWTTVNGNDVPQLVDP